MMMKKTGASARPASRLGLLRKAVFVLLLCAITISPLLLAITNELFAQKKGKPKGMPPANVVVATATSGMIAPQVEYVGTVYYKEVSDVASEVAGSVERVSFEEGRRVKRGRHLVKLNTDILEKKLVSAKSNYEQILTDLEKAKIDLKRIETLYKEDSIAEQIYDDNRFRVSGLEKKALGLEAEMGQLTVELRKATIRAPFSGVILKKHVQRGEWLSRGSPVATIAKNIVMDVIVNVPEEVMRHVRTKRKVAVTVGGKALQGTVFAVIPRGDVATRTFPVKIRVRNSTGALAEGMEARVSLPTGEAQKAVLVPRDALIPKFGDTVVFAVVKSKAVMINVQVVGYQGLQAGVLGEGLKEGMQIVIKGNERLQPGQDVSINQGKKNVKKGS